MLPSAKAMTTYCEFSYACLLACFDTRHHVRLGLVDQLVGQTLETVGQGCSLCRLQLSCLRRAAGANQLHDLRDDFDEPLIVLPEPAKKLDFVLGHELQPIHVEPELIELAKRAQQRRIVGSKQGGGHAVELDRRVMLHLPVRFDLALQRDELLGALIDPAQKLESDSPHHDQEYRNCEKCRQQLGLDAGRHARN
jgi:hypothetical protein